MAGKRKRKIIQVKPAGEEEAYYAYDGGYWTEEEIVCRTADGATLEDLAVLCDQDAENANYHNFVGVHAWLGKQLAQRVGMDAATGIMCDIASAGGLHNVCK